MKKIIVIGAVLALSAGTAGACSIHATHVAAAEAGGQNSLSLFHSFSSYDRPSGGGSALDSHSTQIAFSHWLGERFAVQLGVPYLHRDLDGETESGMGDATLLGLYRAVRRMDGPRHLRVDLFAGVKMPTGDTDALRSEQPAAMPAAHQGMLLAGHAGEVHGEAVAMPAVGHSMGHHLALGSGSWDALFGANAVLRQGDWMARGTTQYSARSEGDYGYRFGDEWSWRVGLHRFVLNEGARSLRIGLDVSGEWRDRNETDGEASTSVKRGAYAGPAVHLVWGPSLQAGLNVELPIYNGDEGLSGAADLRTQASLAWSF